MMAKHIENSAKAGNNKKKKEGFLIRTRQKFKINTDNAKKATTRLFIMILFSIIMGILAFYLMSPAKEIYNSRNAQIKESLNVYDYSGDEREKQKQKADEADNLYGTIIDTYKTNDNPIIEAYANIPSDFTITFNVVEVGIAFLMFLPFFAILLMFLGNPKNFLFAIINMVIVIPFNTIIDWFNSFREDKKSSKKNKSLKTKEAA